MTKGKISQIYLIWTTGTLFASLLFHFVNFKINDWNMLSFTTDGEGVAYAAILLFCGITAILNLILFAVQPLFLKDRNFSLLILLLPLLGFFVTFPDAEYFWLAKIPYALSSALAYEFLNRNQVRSAVQMVIQEIIYAAMALTSYFVISDMFAPAGICINCGIETRQGVVTLLFLALLGGHIWLLLRKKERHRQPQQS